MVEGRVVFPHKPHRRVIAPYVVDLDDITSIAAFFGQGTPDGERLEVQAVFRSLRRVCQETEDVHLRLSESQQLSEECGLVFAL
ncbi:hypothetical protein BDW68DRAFT_164489 [Aspergillus falconensis]